MQRVNIETNSFFSTFAQNLTLFPSLQALPFFIHKGLHALFEVLRTKKKKHKAAIDRVAEMMAINGYNTA